MKLTVIVLLICATQTSASFFDEFRGAMHSVENSFGRLLSDVVTDVSQTIGCTILAVKQVLALDRTFHESSDFNRRCRGQAPAPTPIVPRIDKETAAYSYIESINANDEIKNIEMEFKSETDRLIAISSLLKREVDRIPRELKMRFQFDPEPQEPIGSIWRNLKILHDVEHSNKNSAQASEIHHVLDEALNIMNIKSADANESDDDKIKTIVKDLENDSNDTLTEVEDQFSKWKKEESKEKDEIQSVIDHQKKDFIPLAMDRDKNVTMENNNDSTKEQTSTSRSTTTTTAAPETTTLDPEIEEFQNFILTQFGPKDSDSKQAAVDEATRIIQDSNYRNQVFESLAKSEGADLFDNPELFNFGP